MRRAGVRLLSALLKVKRELKNMAGFEQGAGYRELQETFGLSKMSIYRRLQEGRKAA
jgi:hypothetical protein